LAIVPGRLDTAYNAQTARRLGRNDEKKLAPPCVSTITGRIGLQRWIDLDMPLWGDAGQDAREAVYGNAVDLGVGRRAHCMQAPYKQPPFGIATTCYATAHGIVPGQAGFNALGTITNPQPRIGGDFILAMVITKDPSGTTFLVFLRDSALTYGNLAQKVALDTEGPKFLPQVCMSCHGGTYNPTTRKVDGASFLPLDPELLAFATPAAQAARKRRFATSIS